MSNGYGSLGPYNPPAYGYGGPNNRYAGWGNNANNYPIPNVNRGPGAGAWNAGGFSGSTNYGTAPGSVNLGLAGVGGNGGSITNKGPGAGAYNSGDFAGSINNPSGPINF